MIWVIVFGAIALGGCAMVVCLGISLWRKSHALLDEVGALMGRAEELAALLDRIELPSDHSSQGFPSLRGETGLGRYADDDDLTRGRAT